MKFWRRTYQWINVLPSESGREGKGRMPRGRILHVEPHGGGGYEGGVRVLVMRRG